MTDHAVFPTGASADQTFVFGVVDRPTFEAQPKISAAKSMMLSYDIVRPFMSGKPLRRPTHTRPGAVRVCVVHLFAEEEGGYSVIAADLPGVASHGSSEAEAVKNIREAFAGAIEAYKALCQPVPWLDKPENPEAGAIIRSVAVYV